MKHLSRINLVEAMLLQSDLKVPLVLDILKKDLSHTIFKHVKIIMATIRDVVGDGWRSESNAIERQGATAFTWPS